MADKASEEVLAKEAAFADADYVCFASQLEINPGMFRMYEAHDHLWHPRDFSAILLGDLRNRKLFDMGCGMGEESTYFAKLGAEVTAMDVSPVGVKLTRDRAAHNGLQVEALVGDVTRTGLPSESFDLVHGFGIIHHVGLDAGLEEARRLLKPGGRAVFVEHMSSSRVIDFFRARVAEAHYTSHEQPLKWKACVETGKRYRSFRLFPYSLLHRLRRPLPFLKERVWVRKFDYYMLKLCPPLRHFAGLVVITFEK